MAKKRKIVTPSNWRDLSYHPIAEASDFGDSIDLEGLAAHMQRNGYDKTEPIVLYHGGIVAGRHRHTAAKMAELEPCFVELLGDDEDARQEVMKNLLRQNFTPSQRAMIAAKICTLGGGRPKTSQTCEVSETTETEAANTLNVSPRSISSARKVEEGCIDSIKRAVRVGLIAVSDAAYAADYTEAQQERAFRSVQAKEFKNLKPALPPKAETEGKPKKPKTTPKTGFEGLPRSVQTAMTDTWHLDTAKMLSRVRKQAKGVLAWSVWLDLKDLSEALQTAEQCLLSAAPTKLCPECNGTKKVEKEPCTNCRGGGFLGAQQK